MRLPPQHHYELMNFYVLDVFQATAVFLMLKLFHLRTVEAPLLDILARKEVKSEFIFSLPTYRGLRTTTKPPASPSPPPW